MRFVVSGPSSFVGPPAVPEMTPRGSNFLRNSAFVGRSQAMSEGVHSSDVILNILARQRDPGPVATIITPDALRLRHAPVADCARYDQLRSA
jgi:hypothetical protein